MEEISQASLEKVPIVAVPPGGTAWCPFGFIPIIMSTTPNNDDENDFGGFMCHWILDATVARECDKVDVARVVKAYLKSTLEMPSNLVTNGAIGALTEWVNQFKTTPSDSPAKASVFD